MGICSDFIHKIMVRRNNIPLLKIIRTYLFSISVRWSFVNKKKMWNHFFLKIMIISRILKVVLFIHSLLETSHYLLHNQRRCLKSYGDLRYSWKPLKMTEYVEYIASSITPGENWDEIYDNETGALHRCQLKDLTLASEFTLDVLKILLFNGDLQSPTEDALGIFSYSSTGWLRVFWQ